jgi:hypothetical protein
MSENMQAPANMPPWEDTPTKAAIRRAFDRPNIANLEALAAEVRRAALEEAIRVVREKHHILSIDTAITNSAWAHVSLAIRAVVMRLEALRDAAPPACGADPSTESTVRTPPRTL